MGERLIAYDRNANFQKCLCDRIVQMIGGRDDDEVSPVCVRGLGLRHLGEVVVAA